MNPVTQHLISSYLLMPLLTVIFGIAAYFIARKNKLLNNRKLIVYLLLCGMILALPALCGFMDYSFMPYVYILLVVLYWTAGHYNRFILRKVFASGKEMPSFGIQCLLTVTVTLLEPDCSPWSSTSATNSSMESGPPPACCLLYSRSCIPKR